jgi:hypothetical protein
VPTNDNQSSAIILAETSLFKPCRKARSLVNLLRAAEGGCQLERNEISPSFLVARMRAWRFAELGIVILFSL